MSALCKSNCTQPQLAAAAAAASSAVPDRIVTTSLSCNHYSVGAVIQLVGSFQSQWTKLEAAQEGTFNHKLFK
jgi:hypothetical protein